MMKFATLLRKPPEWMQHDGPHRDIVLTSRSKTVRTVIVDGRVALRDGHAQFVDESRVWRLSRDTGRSIVQRLGFAPGSTWPCTAA